MLTLLQLQHEAGAETILGLTDDDGDGEPDDGVWQAAVAHAEAEVRARVSPCTHGDPPTGLAAGWIATLAVERLFERRREALPGPWAGRAERTRWMLARVAAGLFAVDGVAPPATTAASTRPAASRTATADTLAGL